MMTTAARTVKRLLPPVAANMLRGLHTWLPGATRAWGSTGGTDTAAYCYEVFLKHLTLCCAAGMRGVPRSVGEIGPGDSIGIGLAALTAGAERYTGLDVVPYSLSGNNQRVLGELTRFFRERRSNPSWGWPNYDHLMDARYFPSGILDDALLQRSLEHERLRSIEAALEGNGTGPIRIAYRCPWTAAPAIEPESVDWIYSQSVMEHVDDIEEAYASMHRWLRPGGFISHQIDLTSHQLFARWNGQWGVPRWQWQVIRGRRIYLINRLPFSAHARTIRKYFEVRTELRFEEDGGLSAEQLRPPFDALDEAERRTSGYFVVATKR